MQIWQKEGVTVKTVGRILLGLLAGGLILTPPSASANTLTDSSPSAGAVLASAPNAVSVTGTSTLTDQGTTLSVTDPTGLQVDDGSLTINDTTAVIGLKPLTAAGVYTVSYTLVSDTDIPLSGSYTFLFNAPASISSPSPSATQSTAAPSPNKVTHTADIFVILLMVLAVFVAIFLLWYARMIIRETKDSKRRKRAKRTPRPVRTPGPDKD